MTLAGIRGTVTYGNHLKALICILSTKGMVAMKNLCEIIKGLTGILCSISNSSKNEHLRFENEKKAVKQVYLCNEYVQCR